MNLQDDTHEFVTYYAHARGITVSAAIDELIRKAQAGPKLESSEPDIRHDEYGFPLFPPSPTGQVLTTEMVKKLEEEEFDPKNFA